ncbi:hypothetical protein AKJ36_03345 [candidate division MSBL1 archaeon SCGC-AAA259I07]|uniref:Uncharacterized protein n=1 Tax=candidate division MSBL1 archaeon SCGC-AAA259I07 TaxID=1698266 RepID=A0A133UIY4_9EURY|nr:hypothetical protein AKJ36_03345 [candidate division MSBL1 archaeon SCGC-AAA259I07]
MKGWLLDVYPTSGEEMVICLKGEDGKTRLFRDSFTPEFYVCGSSEKLEGLEKELNNWDAVKSWSYEEKRVRLRDLDRSNVIRVECRSMETLGISLKG